MNKLPKYEKIRLEDVVENQDLPVLIANDVLSESDYSVIYDLVSRTPEQKTIVQPWAGHKAYWTIFPNSIINKIESLASSLIGDELVMAEYSFARYSKEYGYECKLFPHYDTKDSQRITFDLQLNTDENWGIVVEGETYYLKDNQALIFSGTQQMHWREEHKLKPETKIDMIFFHLAYKNDKPLQAGHKEIMEKRSRCLMEETGITSEIYENM